MLLRARNSDREKFSCFLGRGVDKKKNYYGFNRMKSN